MCRRVRRCLTTGSSLIFKRDEDNFQPRTQNKGLVFFRGAFENFRSQAPPGNYFHLEADYITSFNSGRRGIPTD